MNPLAAARAYSAIQGTEMPASPVGGAGQSHRFACPAGQRVPPRPGHERRLDRGLHVEAGREALAERRLANYRRAVGQGNREDPVVEDGRGLAERQPPRLVERLVRIVDEEEDAVADHAVRTKLEHLDIRHPQALDRRVQESGDGRHGGSVTGRGGRFTALGAERG